MTRRPRWWLTSEYPLRAFVCALTHWRYHRPGGFHDAMECPRCGRLWS